MNISASLSLTADAMMTPAALLLRLPLAKMSRNENRSSSPSLHYLGVGDVATGHLDYHPGIAVTVASGIIVDP